MRYVFACLVLLLVPTVEASGQLSVQVTVRSLHLDQSAGYNGWNFGLGLGWDVGPASIETGTYFNSERRMSFYLTAVRALPQDGHIGLSAAAGVVTGYGEGPRPLVAGAGYVGRRPRLRLLFLPTSGGVFSTQLKYPFQ